MKAIDLTKILKGYTSGWVALSADYKKVVASAPNLTSLNAKLKKLGDPKVILIQAGWSYNTYIG
ncbi:MAG: hypothetical protein A2782_03600 [Candidatus Blackburnbacteria bacterium RIFCSPHIGHO2_01_FULL_43_15b]|uniref:DUF5678 domain-containing protein n=1 Tax=Candidatus Blackburnbacteria bacterium RIFCSPHIGHO2_01_FULL_43_15b TaxID=1797513 RepID=A0A1G1V388_9BACT|nr:MAG: hypothetical protein A2782_03600 [Candidatus Blackburnbacteria bacterium RIFCSPHIGHO2_01_FULL_43_15b]